MPVSLSHLSSALPDRFQTVSEAAGEIGLPNRDTRMYERFFGLSRLPRDDRQSVADIITAACAGLPGDARPDLVIHSRTLMSSGPCRADAPVPVRDIAATGIEAFSATMNHCAGGVALLEMLDAILPANGSALVVISDKAFHPAVRHIENTTIMSDGAIAMHATRAPGRFIHLASSTLRKGRYSIISGRPDQITAPGFAEEYIDITAHSIDAALGRAGLGIGDIDHIMPHNVNLPSWDKVAARIGADISRVYLSNVARFGHAFGADPFVNLLDADREGRMAQGDTVLMVSVGLGATASAAVLRVGAPDATPFQTSLQPTREREMPCQI